MRTRSAGLPAKPVKVWSSKALAAGFGSWRVGALEDTSSWPLPPEDSALQVAASKRRPIIGAGVGKEGEGNPRFRVVQRHRHQCFSQYE